MQAHADSLAAFKQMAVRTRNLLSSDGSATRDDVRIIETWQDEEPEEQESKTNGEHGESSQRPTIPPLTFDRNTKLGTMLAKTMEKWLKTALGKFLQVGIQLD
jgi:hypothetical protein